LLPFSLTDFFLTFLNFPDLKPLPASGWDTPPQHASALYAHKKRILVRTPQKRRRVRSFNALKNMRK